jgi:fluoride exporter
MRDLLMVMLGAPVGAGLRFACSRWMAGRWKGWFPLATFLINVVGSLLLGMLFAATQGGRGDGHAMYLLFGTGLLGAFTTFSTFGVEAVTLLQRGKTGTALAYVAGSALLGLLAAGLGAAWYTGA